MGSGLTIPSVAFYSLCFKILYSLLGILGFESLKEIDPLSRSTLYTSLFISKQSSLMMKGSMPIRKGKGASSTSVIVLGRIGMSTCFQHKGNRKEIKATAA